ncbi:MAG: hypothetical protein GKR93_15760 [Gammaproteobacteria bacterium]|nr:hypothetical protein [Gammaproteobacteria bacterium]
MRWIIALLVIVGLIVWGGLLEDAAESNANEFCDSIAIGSLYKDGEAKAMHTGEDKLRIIDESSFSVGFTGIPPFSRHVCEVTREGELVGDKQYYYID